MSFRVLWKLLEFIIILYIFLSNATKGLDQRGVEMLVKIVWFFYLATMC